MEGWRTLVSLVLSRVLSKVRKIDAMDGGVGIDQQESWYGLGVVFLAEIAGHWSCDAWFMSGISAPVGK